jgi:hypothetical protein
MVTVFGVRLVRFSAKGSLGTTAPAIAVLLLALEASAFAAGKPAKLSQIFAPAMLEATVASFEKIAGRAWKVVPGSDKALERRIYKVERCEVEAAIGYGVVRSLYLALSDRCTFDLTAFFATPQPLPTVSKLTFGEAERVLGSGTMVGTCLLPCGNAFRPAVYEHFEGSKADNFIDSVLEVELVDDVSIRAASDWTKAMQDDSSEYYVKDARFNCDGRYDDIAHKLFGNVRITAIRIGYNFTEPWQCD